MDIYDMFMNITETRISIRVTHMSLKGIKTQLNISYYVERSLRINVLKMKKEIFRI